MPRAAKSVAIGNSAQERDLVWMPSHLPAMEQPVIAKRIERRGVGSDRGKGTGSSAATRIIHDDGVSSRGLKDLTMLVGPGGCVQFCALLAAIGFTCLRIFPAQLGLFLIDASPAA